MVIGGPSKKPKKKHVNGAAFAGALLRKLSRAGGAPRISERCWKMNKVRFGESPLQRTRKRRPGFQTNARDGRATHSQKLRCFFETDITATRQKAIRKSQQPCDQQHNRKS